MYKHESRLVWLYYYDWDNSQGSNWMFGDSPGSTSRGVESMNLRGRAVAGQWCPERIQDAGYPWQVFTRRGRWSGDTRLRLECWNNTRADQCCKVLDCVCRITTSFLYYIYKVVLVQSSLGDDLASVYRRLMGVYVSTGDLSNERLVYKHVDTDQFIYYYDWGPNSGANWMISNTPGSNYRVLESENLEKRSLVSECLVTSGQSLQWSSLLDTDHQLGSLTLQCL